jgi:uncharacterized protein (TIGR02145 family)
MKKANLILSVVFMTTIIMTSCEESVSKKKAASTNKTSSNEPVVYKELPIGKQVWMVENVNIDKFRNGDSIPQAKTSKEWEKAGKNKQPAWCYYDNNQKNGAKYGKLYNWYAVNDSRNMAPKGWHIPSDAEWTEVEKQILNSKNSNIDLFNKLSGFRLSQGKFNWIDKCAGWWSTTEGTENFALGRNSYGNSAELRNLNDDMEYGSKKLGLSVRCVRD